MATVDEGGDSPLITAAENGHTDVNLLLECGIFVDLVNFSGWTALLSAAEKNHKDVVDLLLQRGANIDKLAMGRNTALMKLAFNDEITKMALQKPRYIPLFIYRTCYQ